MIKRWSSRWVDTTQYKNKELLIQIVGERTKDLRPANKAKTAYVCTCPFHNEKTPSFKLHNNSGRSSSWAFKCFGCGRAGDIFTFLMLYERWEFWDVLSYLKKCYASYRFPLNPVFNKNQLKIPFPVDGSGNFIWVSSMQQIGYI